MSWEVKFFQTQRGNIPLKTFIEEQDLSTQTRIAHNVMLLRNYGPYLKPPYIKKFQDKLYELRITGKTSIRIFYTITNRKYYLLHAIKKKSQKTPQR